MIDPIETYTLQQFIDCADNDLMSYEKFLIKETSDDLNTKIASFNVLNDYKDELDDLSVTLSLSDKEYMKFRYKPKLLAYTLYGYTELFFILLLLNDICDVKQFNMKELKVLKKDALEDALSYVYNAEKSFLEDYNSATID